MQVTFRSLALENARREIGVREVGANNHGSRVEWFQTFDSLPGEGYAWCNSFVDAMFAVAGRPLVETYRSAGVELTLARAKQLGWVVTNPQPGDLVVFTFSHIGFVDEVRSSTLVTIEGNTGATGAVSDSRNGGDGVYRKVRSRSLVRAYIRVPGAVHKVGGKYPAAVLRTRKGYYAFAAWKLGEGDWKGYGRTNAAVRPSIPKRVPLSWWGRLAKQLAARKVTK
jgi:hypothetical protein